jgi:hypothetical protein
MNNATDSSIQMVMRRIICGDNSGDSDERFQAKSFLFERACQFVSGIYEEFFEIAHGQPFDSHVRTEAPGLAMARSQTRDFPHHPGIAHRTAQRAQVALSAALRFLILRRTTK